MFATISQTAILVAAMLTSRLRAGTLDNIRTLEAGRTDRGVPAMDSFNLPKNGATITTDRSAQSTSPVWYLLSDSRKVKVQDQKVVLFIQSACPCCHQFAPVLKVFSQKTSFDVFLISLDGKDGVEFPDVLPTTSDVMVEYFQSGLPVTTPTTFLTNANTMGTWPLLQGAVKTGEFRSRLSEMLRMALSRQSGESIPLNARGQQ